MDELDKLLTRGVETVLPDKEGLKKLMQKKQITLYQGFDPSMSSLHLGNLVGVMKLRQFQKAGAKVIFLVGDFTGMIGDPTDKLATRKQLTREEVRENAKNWKEEIINLLNFEGNNPAEIKFNSAWNDPLTFKDLINITSNFTVQQMIERDMFQNRLRENKPIYLHEFLYPVAQGYDSVCMDVDLEIGGSDQIFNMLAGRTLMKAVLGKNKYVLGTKLLVDKDGKKVGKTTGNALFISSGPDQFYAGVMSFPDDVIPLAFELLTDEDLTDIDKKVSDNPMTEKKRLAYEIVKLVWNEEKAKAAQELFERTFQENEPDYTLKVFTGEVITVTDAVADIVGSKSEAKRLIDQGAVDQNSRPVKEIMQKIASGDKLKIGKKIFIEVKLK